ncbi:hypothetical protein AC1031_000969 [Aphanomyces cochlioides]|nr:hypothetical protein AC1031_000969 [Aphanomyces cochlioides]
MRATAVAVLSIGLSVAAAQDSCSLEVSLLTSRCGHVVIVDGKSRICPYAPETCSVLSQGCFDSKGKAISDFDTICSYDATKCKNATTSTLNSVFAKVDSDNAGSTDIGPNVKSFMEIGAVCYDSSGKDTGSVIVRQHYCVVDKTCQTQGFTGSRQDSPYALNDIPSFGPNSTTPSFANFNLVQLGTDLSLTLSNQSNSAATSLDLSFNRLSSISDTVFPSSLTTLFVRSNAITSLGNLKKNAPALMFLYDIEATYFIHAADRYSSSNSLASFDGVNFPDKSSVFTFNDNKLQGKLNASIFPSLLQSLNIAQNQITHIEGTFPTSLKNLYMGSNQLDAFDWASSRSPLVTVDLQSNSIAQMKGDIPSSVTSLDLTSNRLTSLPTFSANSKLASLNISQNAISWSSASSFPGSLAVLNVSNTQLQNAVLNLSQFPSSLIALDASNCGIQTVTGDLPQSLQSLRLQNNSIGAWNISPRTVQALAQLPSLVVPTTSSCVDATPTPVQGFQICVRSSTPNGAPVPTPQSSSSNHAAVYTIVAGVVIVVLLIGGYIFYQRRNSNYRDSIAEMPPPVEEVEVVAQTFAKLGTSKSNDAAVELKSEFNRHRVPMREIQILKSLEDLPTAVDGATAARSMLYKAQFNERLVVLKTLTTNEPGEATDAFVAAIRLRAMLDHPNIVAFVGVVWSSNAQTNGYGLLLEYLSHGDLARVLAYDMSREPPERLLQWKPTLRMHYPKVSILLNIAAAIVYLHSFSPPVVHRNIQAKSILLTEKWTAKLNGFKTAPKWTPPDLITAPEVLRGEEWTEMADIYSFGILICELDLGRHPYVNPKNPENDEQIATLVKADLLQPTFSVDCPVQVQDVAKRCLAFDRKSRPPAVEMEFWIRKLVRVDSNAE